MNSKCAIHFWWVFFSIVPLLWGSWIVWMVGEVGQPFWCAFSSYSCTILDWFDSNVHTKKTLQPTLWKMVVETNLLDLILLILGIHQFDQTDRSAPYSWSIIQTTALLLIPLLSFFFHSNWWWPTWRGNLCAAFQSICWLATDAQLVRSVSVYFYACYNASSWYMLSFTLLMGWRAVCAIVR